MAKTWSWVSLDRHNTTPQSLSSLHKRAHQFPSTFHFTPTHGQFKIPAMEQEGLEPTDSGVAARLLVSGVKKEKTDADFSSSDEAEITSTAPRNRAIPQADRISKKHTPSSSELSEDSLTSVAQEEKQKRMEIDMENSAVPKTPDLGRLPTPDLSDLECGSFCACCGHDGERDREIKE